jgi:hypothetical protein
MVTARSKHGLANCYGPVLLRGGGRLVPRRVEMQSATPDAAPQLPPRLNCTEPSRFTCDDEISITKDGHVRVQLNKPNRVACGASK